MDKIRILIFFVLFWFYVLPLYGQPLTNRIYDSGIMPSCCLKALELNDHSVMLFGGDFFPVAGYISKVDSNGNMVWNKMISETNINNDPPVLLDAIADLNHHLVFAARPVTAPVSGYLIKTDTSGNRLWSLKFSHAVTQVVLTQDSNYAVLGSKDISVFGLNAQIQFYKINNSGQVLIAAEYWNMNSFINYNNVYKEALALVQHSNSNFYFLALVGSDLFIMCADATGQFLWNKKIFSSVTDGNFFQKWQKWSMHLAPDGNIFISGKTGNVFSNQALGIMLNTNGNVVWARKATLPSGKINFVNGTVAADSTIFIFLGASDSLETSFDNYIIRADLSGNYISAVSLFDPGQPQRLLWFGNKSSDGFHFLHYYQDSIMTNPALKFVKLDTALFAPCITNQHAPLNFIPEQVTVTDSFPLVSFTPSPFPVLDSLVFTSRSFTEIDSCLVSSINEPEHDTPLIFPNPFTSEIFISYERPSAFQTEIFNSMGKIIFLKMISGNKTENRIDLTDYPAGLYLLKISDGKFQRITKLIKL